MASSAYEWGQEQVLEYNDVTQNSLIYWMMDDGFSYEQAAYAADILIPEE